LKPPVATSPGVNVAQRGRRYRIRPKPSGFAAESMLIDQKRIDGALNRQSELVARKIVCRKIPDETSGIHCFPFILLRLIEHTRLRLSRQAKYPESF
jgi:hypothetical protein